MLRVFKERLTESHLQELDSRWKLLLKELNNRFDSDLDVESVIFLIGLQELGKGFRKYTKDQKLELMHIGICTLLEPLGFYEFKGKDEDGYPHWELIEELPPLSSSQQKAMMISCILDYFGETVIAPE
jgi:hypothetical protein